MRIRMSNSVLDTHHATEIPSISSENTGANDNGKQPSSMPDPKIVTDESSGNTGGIPHDPLYGFVQSPSQPILTQPAVPSSQPSQVPSPVGQQSFSQQAAQGGSSNTGSSEQSTASPEPSSIPFPASNVEGALKGEEEDIADYCEGGYHPLKIGDTLKQGRYLIKHKLGWGYFSTVWLAKDLHYENEYVAIKVVRAAQNYTETAIDELKLLRKIQEGDINHPGRKYIVGLLDQFMHVGPNGAHVCMVFEVLGENLLSLMRRYHYRGIPATLVKQITVQVMLALDYMHRKCGIIHTDLKPENVLIRIKDIGSVLKSMEENPEQSELGQPELETTPHAGSNDSLGTISSETTQHLPDTPSGVQSAESSSSRLPMTPEPGSSQQSFRPVRSSKPQESRLMNYISNSKPLPSPLRRPTSKSSAASVSSVASTIVSDAISSTSSIITPQRSPMHSSDFSIPSSSRPSDFSIPSSDRPSVGSLPSVDEYSSMDTEEDEDYHEKSRYDVFGDDGFTALEDDRITVKVADFGNACCTDRHFTYDIQTRQYRAPEVLLGSEWGASVDCWSLACMVFELLTGDFLFEPQCSKNYSKDEDHIAQIIELLGPPPAYLMQGRFVPGIFDSRGWLLNIHKLKVWPLLDVFIGKYGVDPEKAQQLCNLLLQLLDQDPRMRQDCASLLLTDKWISSYAQQFRPELLDRGREPSNLSIPGWSDEIKRSPRKLEHDLRDSQNILKEMWENGDKIVNP